MTDEIKEEIKIEENKTTDTNTKKKMPLGAKIPLITLGSIVGLLVVVIGGINLCKYSAFQEYYSIRTKLCKIPGLNDNFVPQDIVNVEGSDQYILSGYLSDGNASRLYVTNKDNESYYVSLNYNDGTPFMGHCGGLTIANDKIFIGDSDTTPTHVYTVNLSDVLNKDNKEVTLDEGTIVNNFASSLFSDGTYVYIGEYHYAEKGFNCNHPFTTKSGEEHHAIVSKYDPSDLTTPLAIYSITDKVQGFAILNDGRYIMSTSYGLQASKYYVYNPECCYDTGTTLDGAPLYAIENPTNVIKGPQMAEGLDVVDGDKVISVTETASNKYKFGKLFGAFWCTSLKF